MKSVVHRVVALLLVAFFVLPAYGASDMTPQSVASQLITVARQICPSMMSHDPEMYKLPPPERQLVYYLNGKKYSQEELLDSSKRQQIISCAVSDIEVTFSGNFPSMAMETHKICHEGNYSLFKRHRMFCGYFRSTYEYRNGEWICTKLEGITNR